MIVAGLLLVPIALALRSQSDQPLTGSLAAGAVPIVASHADQPATAVAASAAVAPPVFDGPSPAELSATSAGSSSTHAAPDPTAAAPAAAAETDVTQEAAPSASTGPTATTSPAVGDVTQATVSPGAAVATVSATAERQIPACPSTYVAGSGDSWYRIADAAGVTPSALLAENRATVHTVILPGDEICLPAGATMPSQPSTTTQPPATTQPPVTSAPATTQPPVTSAPASAAQVQQMIREIWPDELEEKALQIAWRESNYIPTAYNGFCCYGVFQIYWSVHASWLDDYGIYSSSDMFDARKNVAAAYALYQRAGGWGPWGG